MNKIDKFKVNFNQNIIKSALMKSLEDSCKEYLVRSTPDLKSEFTITLKNAALPTLKLSNLTDKHLAMRGLKDKSVACVILENYNKRPLDGNTKKSVKDKILKVYIPIVAAAAMCSSYKYYELIEGKHLLDPKRYADCKKSERVNLYGEIPTLTYLLTNNRWKTVSARRYKKYISQVISQCIAYSTARCIIDTPPHPDSIVGEIFTLKPKYKNDDEHDVEEYRNICSDIWSKAYKTPDSLNPFKEDSNDRDM